VRYLNSTSQKNRRTPRGGGEPMAPLNTSLNVIQTDTVQIWRWSPDR